MKKKVFLAVGAGCFVLLHAQAQVDSSSPNLPPLNGQYLASGPIQYNVPGHTIVFNNLDLMNFSQSTPPPPPIIGATQSVLLYLFGVSDLDVDGAAQQVNFSGVFAEQITFSAVGSNTDTYNTLVTELNISGGNLPIGMELRIDPGTPSTGQTAIASEVGGYFHISSFFDVFTDISLDGGITWTAANATPLVTLNLEPVPEPGTIALLSLGGASLLSILRRKS